MRSQLVFSALALTVAALNACSAQSDSSPPRTTGSAGSTSSGTAGATSSGTAGATSTGTAGATSTGFGGSTSTGFGGSTSTGFGGAPSTGTAGATSTGTAGATSSTGCATTKVATGTPAVIDDFEMETNGLIPANDGRLGGWWVSASATATVTPMANAAPKPIVDPSNASNHVLRLTGMDSGTNANLAWGADASVALAATGNCYDASAYKGGISVKLWGIGGVFVSVITAEDKAQMATSGNQRTDIPLTSTPTVYQIPWSMLATGWGVTIPLDLKEVFALDFAPDAGSAANFDIFIDDVQFY